MFDWNTYDIVILAVAGTALVLAAILLFVIVCIHRQGIMGWFSGQSRQQMVSQSQLDKEKAEHQQTRSRLLQEIARIKGERDEYANRLSEQIAIGVKENNANIVDLSDPTRPTKLADKASELYDNQWTDAFEELTQKDGYNNTEAIRLLLDILMKSYDLCRRMAEEQWALVSGWIKDSHNSARIRVALRSGRKTEASQNMPSYQTKISGSLASCCHGEKVRSLMVSPGPVRLYVNACVELCLHMVLNDPPLVWKCPGWTSSTFLAHPQPLSGNLGITVPHEPLTPENDAYYNEGYVSEDDITLQAKIGDTKESAKPDDTTVRAMMNDTTIRDKFNRNFFRPYLNAGEFVEFIVWPAMLLQENGQLMKKGTAEGCN